MYCKSISLGVILLQRRDKSNGNSHIKLHKAIGKIQSQHIKFYDILVGAVRDEHMRYLRRVVNKLDLYVTYKDMMCSKILETHIPFNAPSSRNSVTKGIP